MYTKHQDLLLQSVSCSFSGSSVQSGPCLHTAALYRKKGFTTLTPSIIKFPQVSDVQNEISKVHKSDTLLSFDLLADTGSVHSGTSSDSRLKFRLPVQKQESHFKRSCLVTYIRNISDSTCFKLSGFPTSSHLIRCFLYQSDRETAESLHVKDIITYFFYSLKLAVGNYN